jgi:hypothetical protein
MIFKEVIMKIIIVELEGLTPLLMNNIEHAGIGSQDTRIQTKKYDTKEEAEKSAYFMMDGNKKVLCVPARCLYGCLRIASSFFKAKGKSMKALVAGSVRLEPLNFSLGTDKYEIDLQSVVVNRARIMRSRARLDKWKFKFKLIYDDNYIANPEILRDILVETGVKVGLMDFRPNKGGYFGTFRVSKFEPEK